MTTNIKYTSNDIFSFDPKTDKSFYRKMKSYLSFNTVTFHVSKKVKLREIKNLSYIAKLNQYFENAIKIEFNCVSDDAIKSSYLRAISSVEEYISHIEHNPKVNTQGFINFLEGERNKFQMLSKEFDVSSRLFFNSPIILQLSNGVKSLPVTRYEYDAVGNDFLRGYLIFNMDIRKEFLQGVADKFNDELEIAKNSNNYLRPLIDKNPKLNHRFIFEYCEMLTITGFLPDDHTKDNVANILVKLFNLDQRKFNKAKVDYRKSKIKFQVLPKIFTDLSTE